MRFSGSRRRRWQTRRRELVVDVLALVYNRCARYAGSLEPFRNVSMQAQPREHSVVCGLCWWVMGGSVRAH